MKLKETDIMFMECWDTLMEHCNPETGGLTEELWTDGISFTFVDLNFGEQWAKVSLKKGKAMMLYTIGEHLKAYGHIRLYTCRDNLEVAFLTPVEFDFDNDDLPLGEPSVVPGLNLTFYYD